jgi:hypothetical protein
VHVTSNITDQGFSIFVIKQCCICDKIIKVDVHKFDTERKRYDIENITTGWGI